MSGVRGVREVGDGPPVMQVRKIGGGDVFRVSEKVREASLTLTLCETELHRRECQEVGRNHGEVVPISSLSKVHCDTCKLCFLYHERSGQIHFFICSTPILLMPHDAFHPKAVSQEEINGSGCYLTNKLCAPNCVLLIVPHLIQYATDRRPIGSRLLQLNYPFVLTASFYYHEGGRAVYTVSTMEAFRGERDLCARNSEDRRATGLRDKAR